jgi:hypothetical protein
MHSIVYFINYGLVFNICIIIVSCFFGFYYKKTVVFWQKSLIFYQKYAKTALKHPKIQKNHKKWPRNGLNLLIKKAHPTNILRKYWFFPQNRSIPGRIRSFFHQKYAKTPPIHTKTPLKSSKSPHKTPNSAPEPTHPLKKIIF